MYRRSSAADFRDETRRARREGAYSGVWFFNARGDAFVCKVRSRIFRSCSAATAAWRHRREICIYQADATNISFIICSERLICSPRRAASTCPPPVVPPSSPRTTALSLSPSLSASVEPRHAPFYPSRARRLKLIPNNACKSLGKCTSRVKTAPPSAGNGGHSIFVQRCFRRWRGHAVAKVRVVRARVNYPGLSGRIISSTTSRAFAMCIVSARWMFAFFSPPSNGSVFSRHILHFARYEYHARVCSPSYTRALVYMLCVNNQLICEIYNNRLIRNINSAYWSWNNCRLKLMWFHIQ